MLTKYYSELLKTVNNTTGKETFFIKDCAGMFTRISKKEYKEREDQAEYVGCLHNTTSKTFNRFYKTVTYYINTSRNNE